jgi:tetratricopeptide (TPR) repeat protein
MAAELGRWDEARASFIKACRLADDYKIVAHLGAIEFRLGRYVDAAEHLRYALRTAPPDLSPGARAVGEAMLKAAQSRIGTVTVRVLDAEAEIELDGARVGRTPINEPLFVGTGLRVFYARAEGYVADRVVRNIVAGSTVDVALAPRKQAEGASEAVKPSRPQGDAEPPLRCE